MKKDSFLFDKIIKTVNSLDAGEQKLLLLKLQKTELMKKCKLLEAGINEKDLLVNEEEIPLIISKYRKDKYDQKIRS